MRSVVQRVRRARVTVGETVTGEIAHGLLVLLGVAREDSAADVAWMVNRVTGLRIFEDSAGKMNLCLAEIGGGMLVVSQFTLLADCRKGRRPSFDQAARPEQAQLLYEEFVAGVRAQGIPTETGRFQAEMQVELVNDGPITLIVDSRPSVPAGALPGQ